jgi:hypothetical protein
MSGVKRFLGWAVFAVLLSVILASVLGYWFLSSDSPRNRESTLRIVRQWGRLAEFPKSATNLSIQTTGSMFTRGFHVRFHAPAKEIEDWLKASPGASETTFEQTNPTTRTYFIHPGGGAQHAEVAIDDQKLTVSIYVCWS